MHQVNLIIIYLWRICIASESEIIEIKYSGTKNVLERRKAKIFQSNIILPRIIRPAAIYIQKNANAKHRLDEGCWMPSNEGSNQYQASLLAERMVCQKYWYFQI